MSSRIDDLERKIDELWDKVEQLEATFEEHGGLPAKNYELELSRFDMRIGKIEKELGIE